MASVRLAGISLRYGNGPPVLDRLDLEVADGEFLVVTGPSGSGKTSLLRVVAGLEKPEQGRVFIDGEDVTVVAPARRGVAMVFQEYALLPRRTAEGNIGFPLEILRVGVEERSRRVREEARPLGIEHVLAKGAGQLAAGHRQAVATARALVREGRVLLMDEPLAHLDARSRAAARVQLKRLHIELGLTIIYVTNDPMEGMALGDRLAVLGEGCVRQIGPPADLYRRPADVAVAGMIGTPPMRMLDALVVREEGSPAVDIGPQRIRLGDVAAAEWPGLVAREGRPVLVGVRADALAPAEAGSPFLECLRGKVAGLENLGSEALVEVDLDGGAGTVVARFPAESLPRPADSVELRVATERLGFFDPITGVAVGRYR